MSLSTEEKILVEQRITNDGKNAILAYLLWFFLGIFGAHRFYLEKTGTAFTQLALAIVGILTSVIGVGVIFLIALMVWLFVDLFLIPGIVKAHQNELRIRLTDGMTTPAAAPVPGPENAEQIENS